VEKVKEIIMTTNHYDTIIIGAGQNSPSPLAPLPWGEGDEPRKNKALAFHEGLPGNNFQILDFTEMRVS